MTLPDPNLTADAPVLPLEERDLSAIERGASAHREAALLRASRSGAPTRTRVCLIGMNNLSVLAPEYDRTVAAGEPVQHSLLASALVRSGYDVSMITADYGQPDGAMWRGVKLFKAFSKSAGLPIVRFVHPRWTYLWSAMKRAAADVYYVSCAGAVVGQAALFCKLYGKDLIFRVASDADCAPDTLLIGQWYRRDRAFYEYGLRHAAGVLVQSEKQRRLLLRNYGLESTVAPLLVETRAEQRKFAERDIPVLWVANFRPLKRPDVFLELAQSYCATSFHMVGGPVAGEQSFFEQVRQRAAALSNVVFHGPLPYHDANELYRRARVFVNTSDIEGFPNTYLQAWASGAPVVAFFDPDNLIEREGLGVAVRSPAELAEAVQYLVADEEVWNAASSRCLAFIQRSYADERVLAPYRSLIDLPRAERSRAR